MNWLDALIALAVVWSGLRGRRQGLVREVLLTGSAIAALALALRAAPDWARAGSVQFGIGAGVSYVLAFALILVAVIGGGYLATRLLDQRLVHTVMGDKFNRWGGFLVGGLKGAIIVLVVVVALLQTPWPAANRAVSGSTLALGLLQTAPSVYEGAARVFPQRSP